MAVTGIGMIVFAATCFSNVPLMGTVFLIPGENIMQAEIADPVFRYALFLVGGLLTAYGVQLQVRIGFTNPLKECNQDAIPGKPFSRRKPWRPWGQA